PTAAAFKPAEGIERLAVLQPFFGIAIAASKQGAQYASLYHVTQRPASIAFPAPTLTRMNLRGRRLDPTAAGFIPQQDRSVGAAPLDSTPLRISAPTLQLFDGEAIPQTRATSQW